jgi:hypothetical protein
MGGTKVNHENLQLNTDKVTEGGGEGWWWTDRCHGFPKEVKQLTEGKKLWGENVCEGNWITVTV